MTELISKADAIEAVLTYFIPRSHTGERGEHEEDFVRTIFNALPSSDAEEVVLHKILQKGMIEIPSAEANSEDLIIKGAKGIQDGLYNIKDGKLFKYKAKGGTVRTYPIVPLADVVQGEWIEKYNGNGWNDFWDYTCSNCGKKYERADAVLYHAHYCPNCGAKMKGGAE